jgi:hypothetical protein
MTLSEYLIEAVAQRKPGKYGPESNKQSIIDWCNEHNFTQVKWSAGIRIYNLPEGNCYLLGPNFSDNEKTNWLRVHNKDINSLTFWFDKSGKVYDIQYLESDWRNGEISKTFDEATKMLLSMVK